MNSLKNLEESMGCNTIRDDHGGGVIYQRVHMDKAEFDEMIRKVEEEYSDLQDENARLRSCLSDDAENARMIMGENSKLRELLAELYQCSRQVGCDHCGDGYRRTCSVLNHLRELGMEVVV